MARSNRIQMEERNQAILDFCEQQQPCTVRGVYYNLTTKDLVAKTDAGYQQVARACKKLRLDGRLPWEYIVDNTRWMRKPQTFSSVEAALENTARTYRRDYLIAYGLDIEIWLEKDALSGVFYGVTSKWDIPLMVSRGFASLTFLRSAAMSLSSGAHVYIFSDYDFAGEQLQESIARGLRDFSEKDIHVTRAMLSNEQVTQWDLPTREPKKNDVKAGYDFCCELDAVPPNVMRSEIEACILQNADIENLEHLRNVERMERQSIQSVFRHHTERK